MNKELINDIYATLTGTAAEGSRVPGVENAFAPGSRCDRMYRQMAAYRERLWERLGTEDDEDIEGILSCMSAIEMELCGKMFEYGVQFAARFLNNVGR